MRSAALWSRTATPPEPPSPSMSPLKSSVEFESRSFFFLDNMPARRFPPPWTAEVTPNCFIVRDANGQKLAYVYYENEPGRRSAAKLLSQDEARRIAANIAKLPVAKTARPAAQLAPLSYSQTNLTGAQTSGVEYAQRWW